MLRGVFNVLVVLNGAGGGFFTFSGGGGNAGGGASGIFVDMVPVTPGETIKIYVGAGGQGGANGTHPSIAFIGSTGNPPWFKSS
ncbi:glycine-rich domain-containing protein [Lysinibacillus sp. RSDA_15]|uniref:glycine-rich domain-containing protein n=1 Tax=Lysinibacillus sp. RSDA_15 TaxID=3391421 RepID=UPI003A4D30B6